MPGKSSIYWKSLRPFAFGGSLLPLTLGSFSALGEGVFTWQRFILSIAGVWLIHAAGNLTNDYYDYRFDLDSIKTRGKKNPLVTGELTSFYYTRMIAIFFLSSFIVGLFLWKPGDFWLPVLGITGAFFAYFYTAPPLSFKYRGWGTIIIFFVFGPLLTGGGYLIQVGEFKTLPFLLGIFPGLHMTAVLLTNELMDYNSDREKQILTTAIKLGRKNSTTVLLILLCLPFLLLILFVLLDIFPARVLIAMATLPAIFNFFLKVKKDGPTDSQLDIIAAKFHILFTATLIITLL